MQAKKRKEKGGGRNGDGNRALGRLRRRYLKEISVYEYGITG